MIGFYERGRGRMVIPKEKQGANKSSEVTTYHLAPEELEKYRALSVVQKKRPMTVPQGRKKSQHK